MNARADLVDVKLTMARRPSTLNATRSKVAHLRADVDHRFTTKSTVAALRQDIDMLCAEMQHKATKIRLLNNILALGRDTAASRLASSTYVIIER